MFRGVSDTAKFSPAFRLLKHIPLLIICWGSLSERVSSSVGRTSVRKPFDLRPPVIVASPYLDADVVLPPLDVAAAPIIEESAVVIGFGQQ